MKIKKNILKWGLENILLLICKIVLCGIIFSLCTHLGFLKSKKFQKRVGQLKNFKNALEIFKTKIKYTKQPIKEVFEELGNQIEGETGQVFFSVLEYEDINIGWTESLLSSNLALSIEDLEILSNLGNTLRKNRFRRTNKPNRFSKQFFRYTN